MSTLIADFLAGYKGNTAKAYTRDLADFTAYLAGRDPFTLVRVDIDTYARHMEQQGRSPATVARRLSTVNGLYTYAQQAGLASANPMQHVRRPRVSQDSQTVGLSQTEARAILIAARADEVRTYAMIAFLLQTGARLGEALALQVEDIFIDGGYRVARLHGKGGKVRIIPIPGVAHALDELIDGRTEGPVFRTRTGGTWSQSQVFRKVQAMALAAGIEQPERITPHSLRHTAATSALGAGASIQDTQDLLGHADPRTTQRYNRARFNLANSAAHVLAGIFQETA